MRKISRIWNPEANRGFSLRSCFKILYKEDPIDISWNTIWSLVPLSSVQSSVIYLFILFFAFFSCFAWTAVLGKIFTIDNLIKRSLYLLNVCLLCYGNEEILYLLIHCQSLEVWCAMLKEFGQCWVIPRDLQSSFCGWMTMAFSNRGRQIWLLVPAVVVCAIWFERNNHSLTATLNSVIKFIFRLLVVRIVPT